MSQEMWIFIILLLIGLSIIVVALILGKPHRQPLEQIINLQFNQKGFNFKLDVWSFFALLGVIIIGAGIFIVYQNQEHQRNQVGSKIQDLENRLKQKERELANKEEEVKIIKTEKMKEIRSIMENLIEHSIDFKFSFKDQEPFPNKITRDMITVLILKEGDNAPVEHQYITIIPGKTSSASAKIRQLKKGDMVSIMVQEGNNTWQSQFFKIPLSFPVDSWDTY